MNKAKIFSTLFLLQLSPAILAGPVTIDFTAILDSSGPKPEGITTGDILTGSITYDLGQIATQYNDSNNGVYSFLSGASLFQFSVGGFSRSSELNGIQLSNSFVDEIVFWVDLPATSAADEQWSLTLRDTSAQAWNTTFLESIATGDITDLSSFNQSNDINLFSFQDALPGPDHPRLSGALQTLSGQTSSVPEPAPFGLILFGVIVMLASRMGKNHTAIIS